MANWSDPQPTATRFTAGLGARSEAYDAGLRSYMLRVYNYMASAVLLSGLVAMFFAWGGANSPAAHIFTGGGVLPWIIQLAPLGFIFAMNFGLRRMSEGGLQALFWGFAVTMGLSLSVWLLVYTGESVAGAFFAAASGFAGLSLYGYTTKRDLTAWGAFFIVGLVGLIVASLINLFVHSGPMALVISVIGVFIFAGLTAYDTQRIKSMYSHVAGTDQEGRVVIMAATSLYLDFINMFLFILQLFGNRR